jgi:DNA primase
MNVRNTLWICHSAVCGARGDAVSFLTQFHNLTEAEAQRVIDERYGGPGISIEVGGFMAEYERLSAGVPSEPERTRPSEEWLDRFSVPWRVVGTDDRYVTPYGYMVGRGLDQDTLDAWQIGYDEISDRITIPVRDAEGQLVGFKGRAWREGQQPKYLIVGNVPGRPQRYDFDTYAKSQVVFGLDRAQGDRVVCCEGELNAIMLHQYGEYGAVSVAGSLFSAKQAELIIRRFSRAVVYFDGDDAGRSGTKTVVAALEPYMPVSVVVDPPDDAAALGAAALPLIADAIPALQIATI